MRNNSGFTYVILALFLGSFSQSVVGANDGLAVLPTPSTRVFMHSVADANDSQPVVISPHGSDMNPGTPEQPMATLEAARDLIRVGQPGKANHGYARGVLPDQTAGAG